MIHSVQFTVVLDTNVIYPVIIRDFFVVFHQPIYDVVEGVIEDVIEGVAEDVTKDVTENVTENVTVKLLKNGLLKQYEVLVNNPEHADQFIS